MFFIKKKRYSILESGLLQGMTDCHCHILPGVDDGVRNLTHSLEILSFYEQAGIREVWLTPHVMEDIPNTPVFLQERFATLQAAYEGPVVLHLAAEHMLDNLFEDRLAQGDLLPIGAGGNHLLVETSYFNPPMDFHPLLERIKAKGWFIVLAHPERYVYMDDRDYRRLKEMGVKFQLNLPSLVGGYGKAALQKASDLLKKGMYDCTGSDLHRLSAFQDAISKSSLGKRERELLSDLMPRTI